MLKMNQVAVEPEIVKKNYPESLAQRVTESYLWELTNPVELATGVLFDVARKSVAEVALPESQIRIHSFVYDVQCPASDGINRLDNVRPSGRDPNSAPLLSDLNTRLSGCPSLCFVDDSMDSIYHDHIVENKFHNYDQIEGYGGAWEFIGVNRPVTAESLEDIQSGEPIPGKFTAHDLGMVNVIATLHRHRCEESGNRLVLLRVDTPFGEIEFLLYRNLLISEDERSIVWKTFCPSDLVDMGERDIREDFGAHYDKTIVDFINRTGYRKEILLYVKPDPTDSQYNVIYYEL